MSVKNPSLATMQSFLEDDGRQANMVGVNESLSHSNDSLDDSIQSDSLAHYGVKGMKWGVRRTDAQLSKASGAKSSSKSKSTSDTPSRVSSAAKAVKDRVSRARQAKAEEKVEQAKAAAQATRLSADAERAIQASTKAPHQRSNQEMRDAINRAQQVEQYNKLFGGNDKAKMVADMKLEKEYRSLVKELTPEKTSLAKKAIAAAPAGWAAYKTLNDMSGGALNGAVMKKMGVKTKTNPLDQLENATKLLNAKTKNAQAQRDYDRVAPKPKNPLFTGKPQRSKSAEAVSSYANDAIKDARDLNKILEDYLKE